MVKLGFTTWTKGTVQKVFGYFSQFQKIHEWDLNVQSAKILKETPNKIGSAYEVVSMWKGKPSSLVYHMIDYKKNDRIYLQAQNGMIKATDLLIFKQKDGGTQITYNADISLRHVLWLFTPFVKNDFEQLADRAKKGMEDKCKQLFG